MIAIDHQAAERAAVSPQAVSDLLRSPLRLADALENRVTCGRCVHDAPSIERAIFINNSTGIRGYSAPMSTERKLSRAGIATR